MVAFKMPPDAVSATQKLEVSFRLGNEAADRITETFKRPIELEMEKCYLPYLLFSKKRYAGLMFTRPDKPDYIDAKGIQLVRRDNAPFVKDVCQTVLRMIMYDRALFESVELVRQKASELLRRTVPVDQLVVSKSLRKDYKNACQPHITVANKIAERTGAGPQCGERVGYVILETGSTKGTKISERAEDPAHVVAAGISHTVDVLYYLEHGLISPLESFFDLFMDNSKDQIFGELIREFKTRRAGQHSITNFFKQQNPNKCPKLKL